MQDPGPTPQEIEAVKMSVFIATSTTLTAELTTAAAEVSSPLVEPPLAKPEAQLVQQIPTASHATRLRRAFSEDDAAHWQGL